MNKELRYWPVAITLGVFSAVSFAICVAWDAAFPQWAMRAAWEPLLPGFDWLSVGSFFLGLAESFVYGLWLAVLVPLFNWVRRLSVGRAAGGSRVAASRP